MDQVNVETNIKSEKKPGEMPSGMCVFYILLFI